MLDPDGLYELDPVQPQPGELSRPVLVHALSGFVDAGGAGRLAAEHLLGTLPHRKLQSLKRREMILHRALPPTVSAAFLSSMPRNPSLNCAPWPKAPEPKSLAKSFSDVTAQMLQL